MHTIDEIRARLRMEASLNPTNATRFFKTNPGEYAEHDQFIGVKVPILRTIARQYQYLTYDEIIHLLQSPMNEERLLALFIMVHQYQKGSEIIKQEIFELYLKTIKQINNWNLVDASAHLIIGAHVYEKPNDLLITLAQSPILWERRIAIVATWHAIRKNDPTLTIAIARILLRDTHDLIHKAVGWMLREAGKRNLNALIQFLDTHATTMPRTMLRYALEKLSPDAQKKYMLLKQTI